MLPGRHLDLPSAQQQLRRLALPRVVMETPVNLTPRQRDLLMELEAINQRDGGRHNPRAKSWMDKVREFFES